MSTAPPRTGGDRTFAFLSDPYRFISRRAARLSAPVFETRLLLRPTLCMVGSEAAELFYDEALFQRQGAAPEPVLATLFGRGGVQTLDGVPHRLRKAFFIELLQPPTLAALGRAVALGWQDRLRSAPPGGRLPLYETAQQVLADAVCAWAGLPADPSSAPQRAGQLAALFDSAAGGPMRHLRARRARQALEAWLQQQINAVRAGRHAAPTGCALDRIARLADPEGRVLPARQAATELLNILRPVTAISVYLVLAAHALLGLPSMLPRLLGGDPADMRHFINEVRRYYPFFPVLMARVRQDFEWKGVRFAAGRRTLLEIYGTHHDPGVWTQPERFDPARFARGEPPRFGFLPQGGGDVRLHHRCPGEDTVLTLTAASLDVLLTTCALERAGRDGRIDFGRLPAQPRASIWLSPLA